MSGSLSIIRRTMRPRLILALMPLIALIMNGSRALAGITCSDVVSGCSFIRWDNGMLCAQNDCYGWPFTCWNRHPCDAKRYQNTTSGLYYWTAKINCGTKYDDTPDGWTYSCSNGAGW